MSHLFVSVLMVGVFTWCSARAAELKSAPTLNVVNIPHDPANEDNPYFTASEICLTTVSPLDQTVEVGGTANFEVSTDHNLVTYQWMADCAPIPGATNATLTIAPVMLESAGYYTCFAYRHGEFAMSKHLQLIVSQRIGTNVLHLAARPAPGVKGVMDLLPEAYQAPKKQSSIRQAKPFGEFLADYELQRLDGPPGSVLSPRLAPMSMASSMPMALLTAFLAPTNAFPNLIEVGNVYGAGCPGNYGAILRYTTGWYPKSIRAPGAPPPPPWKIRATWSSPQPVCTALKFHDGYRQGCTPGTEYDLTSLSPNLTRLHKFYAYLPLGSSPTGYFILEVTGFQ